MIFEWDEAKRLSNLEKHGFDFNDAYLLFDAPYVQAGATTVGSESRWLVTGTIKGVLATAIVTRRGASIRVISLRRARHEERRGHQALHGGRA